MHDSLDLSVSSPEQAELVAQLGRDAVEFEVPMKVDIAYGGTWGDAKHSWEERNAAAAKSTVTVVQLPEPLTSKQNEEVLSISRRPHAEPAHLSRSLPLLRLRCARQPDRLADCGRRYEPHQRD